MTRLLTTLSLMLAVLIGSTGVSYAGCPGSPRSNTTYFPSARYLAPHTNQAPWNNCFGTFTWHYGDRYVGYYKNDRPHGRGTFTWDNGTYYVGDFKGGRPHGRGTMYLYKEGKRVGKRTGEWRNGNPYGKGTMLTDDQIRQREISRARKSLEKQKAQESINRKIQKCMFKNVGKITNKITEQIVREECKERAKN